MKTRANENGQRHTAVRPDVFAGKHKLRTWVFSPDEAQDWCDVLWVTELGEGRYLRCTRSGKLQAYESTSSPKEAGYSIWFKEMP